MPDTLERIGVRLGDGEPLAPADVETVVATSDLVGLGALADARRRQLHGDQVTFVRVAEVRVGEGTQAEAEAPAPGAGEVRIVGRPPTRAMALEVAQRVAERVSEVPVTGFVLDELAQLCDGAADLERLLIELKSAGLAGIAEVRVETPDVSECLEVAEAAGLDVATLAVGSSQANNGLDLIRLATKVRRGVAGLRAFDPLPSSVASRPTTGYGDARQVALARLLVDNIDSIQVDWAGYGPKMAQVALTFGADDVDSVSPLDSDALGWRRTPLEEITRNIRAAAFVPRQRTGRFEVLNE